MNPVLPAGLVVVSGDTSVDDRARELAQRLGVPIADKSVVAHWCLVCTRHGLELRQSGADGPVRIGSQPDRHWQVSRRDPLGRAIGKGADTVVDATAGLGGDTLLMARMGFALTAIEKSPLIALLLEDRLAKAGVSAEVIAGDASRILPTLDPRPSVVYLDPMFPPRRRSSALPRKELVTLAEIASLPEDGDNERLLDAALACATQRVVVKRLPESPDLGRPPSHSHPGKTVRYDVYLTQRPAESAKP